MDVAGEDDATLVVEKQPDDRFEVVDAFGERLELVYEEDALFLA